MTSIFSELFCFFSVPNGVFSELFSVFSVLFCGSWVGYAALHLVHADALLDVILRCLQQVARRPKPVHRLQSYGHLPVLGPFLTARLTLYYILFEVHFPVSNILQRYEVSATWPNVFISI
jgi:hypothetical protein